MDIVYCGNHCFKGMEAKERFLSENNSTFEAASDFWSFTEQCFKTCPYKNAHNKVAAEPANSI